MKRTMAVLLSIAMLLSAASFAIAENGMKVAMITDYDDVIDHSFNQTVYEAAKAFCEANGLDLQYFRPVSDTDEARISSIGEAVSKGFNVILLPGYKFGPAIGAVQEEYSDTKFIALDVSKDDLGDTVLKENVYCAVYQEELGGYMAGYAAVKLGYRKLGFLGGEKVPAVVRYGFGFVQGVNAAAEELGITADVEIQYVYGGQFRADSEITAYMDNWYQTVGVEVVFACGGSIYNSAADAAAKVNGKIIGVDVDQSAVIDTFYGEGMTVTSAIKSLAATVKLLLGEVKAGNFADYGGKIETFGLVSADPETNYVQIAPTTQFADTFTKEDYGTLVAKLLSNELTVSSAIDEMPAVSVTVIDNGSIKQ